jgi:hypothetical protein
MHWRGHGLHAREHGRDAYSVPAGQRGDSCGSSRADMLNVGSGEPGERSDVGAMEALPAVEDTFVMPRAVASEHSGLNSVR